MSDQNFILLVGGIFAVIVIAVVSHMRIDALEDRLQKIECAFIIEEDGSASPRIDDDARFRCMSKD